ARSRWPDSQSVGMLVVGADAGADPHVRTFTYSVTQPGGVSQLPGALGSFLAYDAAFRGGVRVAAAHFDTRLGHGVMPGSGPGAPADVEVFRNDGSELGSFLAYGTGFQGGVYVGSVYQANGDVQGVGWEVVTGAGAGASPHVKTFHVGAGGDVTE